MSETEIVKSVLLAVGCHPNVCVWRQNTGKLQDRTGRWVAYGIIGGGDISGIIYPGGRRLEIECKMPGKKQDPDQVNFQHMIEENDGVYLLVNSAEQARSEIERVIEEQYGRHPTTTRFDTSIYAARASADAAANASGPVRSHDNAHNGRRAGRNAR